MSTTWIVILSVAGWLAVSLIVARVAGRLDYRHSTGPDGQQVASPVDSAETVALWAATLWPLALAVAAVFAPFFAVGWLVTRCARSGIAAEQAANQPRADRIHQLRADADSWDAKRTTGTDAERAVAAQVAQLCRDQADELAKGAGR